MASATSVFTASAAERKEIQSGSAHAEGAYYQGHIGLAYQLFDRAAESRAVLGSMGAEFELVRTCMKDATAFW